MKRIKQKIWIVSFFLIILFPSIIYPFVRGERDEENRENRNENEKPIFSPDNMETYPSDYEAYYNDHIPFRNTLIKMNSYLDYYVFHESPNQDVVVGKDGWLFYAGKEDGVPIRQAVGKTYYTEEELAAISDNIAEMRREIENRGMEFLIFIAPNKERIYGENLPEYYGGTTGDTSTEQLIAYLRENTDVNIIFAYEEMMKQKELHPELFFYYHLDTHWNNAGGYVGASVLLKELGCSLPDIEQVKVEKQLLSSGDLSNMMNMGIPNGETDYKISGYNELETECVKCEFSTEFIYHTQGADPRKLFVYRDSFMTAMFPYVVPSFEDSYMVNATYYTPEMLEEQKADIFVLEIVERHLKNLADINLIE